MSLKGKYLRLSIYYSCLCTDSFRQVTQKKTVHGIENVVNYFCHSDLQLGNSCRFGQCIGKAKTNDSVC